MWTFAEGYFWLIATVLFILAVIARGFYMDPMDIILYSIIIMYKQNVFYLFYKPLRFLLAPIYFLVYGISLTVTRIHAAITIANDDWGTRAVEKEEPEELVVSEEAKEGKRVAV